MTRHLSICAALIGALLCVYLQTLHFDFVGYDDPLFTTRNPVVQMGLTGDSIRWAFTTGHASNWFPATWLSHMLDVQIWGMDPGGHHTTNVALHALNVLLLYGVVYSLTGALAPSAIAAVLLAVHPIHVETVAWISERKGLLSQAFGLAALGAYVGYARRGGILRYLVVFATLALGLMAKSMLTTLPFVFLLLDYWPLRRLRLAARAENTVDEVHVASAAGLRNAAWLVVEKLPLIGLSAASSALTISAQAAGGSVVATASYWVPLKASLPNAVLAYVTYLGHLIVPTGLGPLYPHPYMPGAGGTPPSLWEVIGAALLLVVLTRGVLASRRRYAVVGWLWFLGTLVPVIGLIQVGSQALADRYAYLPMIGLYIAIGLGFAELVAAARRRAPILGSALIVFGLLVVLGFTVVAHDQARHWRSSASLWQRGLEVAPRSPPMLCEVGNLARDEGRYDEAVRHYHRALKIDPTHGDSHVDWGRTLTTQGRHEAAISHLRKALEIDPHHGRAHYHLAVSLEAIGRIEEAIRHYEHALRVDPTDKAAQWGLRAARHAAPTR